LGLIDRGFRHAIKVVTEIALAIHATYGVVSG
jgi:hypothetical protein